MVVGGPNGQINHGQFMKAAKRLFGLKGHGCLMSHLAKSELSKGDTQIKTPDVDETFEIGEGGEITFETFEANCKNGKGRPDSPGKSANAPGRGK